MNQLVLVTGGAGFIGSEVVRKLVSQGYRVRIADNLSKPHHTKNTLNNIDFRQVDLTDKNKCLEVFAAVDIVINMAAKIGGIGYFHKYPATILSDNNKIYSNTFESAVKSKVKRMVYISSSMVYESATRFPSQEDDVNDIPVPITAYGMSKLVGEWYCRSFLDEYGLEYSIVRPFNAYGINEYPESEVGYAHVIPDLVRKILKNQYPLEILGDGNQTRCFTHISDIADGIIAVATNKKAKNKAFNISHPQEIKITELAFKLWKLCGRNEPFKTISAKSFQHDVKRRIPDVSKANQLLGWKAKISLDKGLPDVVNWVKENL